MKVTISDIAKIAKCSVSTVSKALSDSSDLNVKTKEEILKYAVELGYNFSRKKANAKGKIAAFVQSTKVDTIRFEYQMLFNFNLVAGRNGYDVEIIQKNTSDHLWEYRHETEGKDYAGVFLLRTSDIERVREDIMKSSLPIVAITPSQTDISCVSLYSSSPKRQFLKSIFIYSKPPFSNL